LWRECFKVRGPDKGELEKGQLEKAWLEIEPAYKMVIEN
jgi:hypothetical protein